MARMLARAEVSPAAKTRELPAILRTEATAILDQDRAMCEAIASRPPCSSLDGARVLTHCNAGAPSPRLTPALAFAPVYLAYREGRRVSVLRMRHARRCKGAALTAWELARAGISGDGPHRRCAPSLMRAGEIDIVLVGAGSRRGQRRHGQQDRHLHAVAVAAKHHGILFYVCARGRRSIVQWRTAAHPDRAAPAGRSAVRGPGVAAPPDATVRNPAFDLTPCRADRRVITDKGVYRAPYSFTYEMRSRD
jgi:methylthioribose-1-phosphate isomerase